MKTTNTCLAKVSYFVFSTITSFFFGFFMQPLIHNNDTAFNVITTIFSTLSGFLIAIISVIGMSKALIKDETWRVGELYRPTVKRRLKQHVFLFFIYLITLSFCLVLSIVKDADCTELTNNIYACKSLYYVEFLLAFFSFFSLLQSFILPITFYKTYMESYDQSIEQKIKK